MKTADEINSTVKNLSYYAGIIYNLCKRQLDEDEVLAAKVGEEGLCWDIRRNSIGAISNCCRRIEMECHIIGINVSNAEKQDNAIKEIIVKNE